MDPFGFQADGYVWQESDPAWLKELKRIAALRYIFLCDFVVMNFGRSLFRPVPVRPIARTSHYLLQRTYSKYSKFMQWIELSVLRLRNVPTVVIYQGTDARQVDISITQATHSLASIELPDHHNPALDDLKRQQIELLSKYACRIYALNPDLMRVLPKGTEFLPYFHVEVPQPSTTPSQWVTGDPLIVGHAPSHRGIKGTDHVIEVVNKLKDAGYQIELRLIEGLSHQDALQEISNVHILVDQLHAGWYGGVAVEAMAMGVPVLAYIRREDLEFLPARMAKDLPIQSVTPESLERVLVNVTEMTTEEFQRWQSKSLDYVLDWHNPKSITDELFSQWFP